MEIIRERSVQHSNSRAKRLYAENFFEVGEGKPQDLIKGHEKWLEGELKKFGLKPDYSTWRQFHDNAIERSLDQKVDYSLGVLERQTFQSVRNVIQALAWYHCPEGASWKEPVINISLNSSIFVDNDRVVAAAKRGRNTNRQRRFMGNDRYKSDMKGYVGEAGEDAKFVFEINEHYEGTQGTLWLNEASVKGWPPAGVKASYDVDKNMLRVSFTNPNDYMGWQQNPTTGNLEYKLDYLNRLLQTLTTATQEGQIDIIGVQTWRAY